VRLAPSTNLAAVVDLDPQKAEEAGARHGCPAFSTIEEMLNDVDVELVMVCTPDHLHVAPVCAAAQAGKHIFLEKPIATSLRDADTILSAIEQNKVSFTVGHCLRFDPKYVEVKRRIANGDIGEVVSIYARRQNRASNQKYLQGRVSSLLFLAVHDIDILNWIIGSRPLSVYCASTNSVMSSLGYDIDDVSWTTIRYENGVVGVVESGWLLPDTYPRTGHFELVATGSQGLANLSQFNEGLSIANQSYIHVPLVDRLTPQIEHFAGAILEDSKPLVSGREARLAMEVALAATRSARHHSEVTLPLEEL
jgi:UDP-N-acetylglucosamine 3-dehydrogenase